MKLPLYGISVGDQILDWLKSGIFRNYVENNKITGKCFIVYINEVDICDLPGVRKTLRWCSTHTTAPWTIIITGAYIFVSEKDATMFKMVWHNGSS